MATNHTKQYKLCQWLPTDQVRRTDFNEDNAKVEAALAGLASGKANASALNSLSTTVSKKANASALNSLSATVSKKADASALNTLQSKVTQLSSTVSTHTTQLKGKGNCQVYQTSYTGAGKAGAASKLSFTFSAAPMMVFVFRVNDVEPQILMRGVTKGFGDLTISWSGNTVSWYSPSSATYQLNENGKTYKLCALLSC